MRHRNYTFKIGRDSAHRKAMLANMVCSLIQHQRIVTTITKAKEASRLADKMITLGKRGTLHARRQAIARLRHPRVAHLLFEEVAPQFADRTGGYTRVIRMGPRVGDGAENAVLELVREPVQSTEGQATLDEEGVASAEQDTNNQDKAAGEGQADSQEAASS